MNKKAIFIAAAALALFACDTEKQLDKKAEETAVKLSDVAVSGTPDYVDEDGVAWFKEPPVLSWKGTGENLSYTVSLNGGEEITVQEGYTLPNETGVYDILFTATDVFGRSQYAQLAVGVDVSDPVITFVNSSSSWKIGEEKSFIDSVPENAMRDEGSGLNFETRNGYWEDEEAVAAAKHGDVFNRIFTIADNVGRTASYSHPVKFADPNYVGIDGQYFEPVKVIDFSEVPDAGIDGITLTEELSWTAKDALGLTLVCDDSDKHTDSKMTVTSPALPKAGTYDAISLTFTPRENYKPNFYVGDGNYGFEFSKSGNADFILNEWTKRQSVGLKQGESNTIGFWEKGGQDAAWFSVLGNTLKDVPGVVPSGKTLLTDASSLTFGLHSDGSVGSVSIEKITFYKAVVPAAEGE